MMSYADTNIDETDLRPAFELWMVDVVNDPAAHLRFANTLSMLEHVGSVKIARTQSGESITEETLQHLAEETRHAQVLKKIVHGIDAGSAPDYADAWLMAGPSARAYFARLDAGVRAFARARLAEEIRHRAAYLLVTWLVELRASWLYPAYQRALKEGGLRFSVRSIIGEEERHLEDIQAGMAELGIADHPDLPLLLAHESRLFERLARRMMEGSMQNSECKIQH
jgi:hypothetical protein